MAANLNKTKRRIASVTSTKKITNAMELVATVKLKKYRNGMLSNSSYVEEITNLMIVLFKNAGSDVDETFVSENDSPITLYVVVTSNLGLCASYNNDIFKFVEKNVPIADSEILVVGTKGANYFAKSGYRTNDQFIDVTESFSSERIDKMCDFLRLNFENKKYKAIKLIYTKYVNSIRFKPDEITLFPVEKQTDESGYGYSAIFDPDCKTLINELLPIYASSVLYQKLIESQVSEQASRRNAMESATDNANELIDKLTLEYNNARQSNITQEIAEVVSSTIK